MYKPRIKLIIATGESHYVSEVRAPHVTDAMYDAAWDLIYTLSTGKRRKPKSRYKAYREKQERERAASKKLLKKPKTVKTKREAPVLQLLQMQAHIFEPCTSQRFVGPADETCEHCGKDPHNMVHQEQFHKESQ